MKIKWISIIGYIVLGFGLTIVDASLTKSYSNTLNGGTIQLTNETEADFPALTKLTVYQAIHKALEVVQGNVLKTELENEDSFLVYDVEVVTADKAIMEIEVDAGSGKVLAVKRDKMDGADRESSDHDSDRVFED